MRTPPRRRAIALACTALATAAVVGARDGTQRQSPPSDRALHAATATERSAPRAGIQAQIDRLATSGPATPEQAVELDGLPPAGFLRRERPEVLAVASRFLHGYLAFEVRQGGQAAVRRVAETSTPDLAADLLSGGAQLPAAMDRLPPRARVYAIDVEFDKPPVAAQVRAEVTRGSDLSDIAVIVERRAARWVVTQIVE
jgi:hypothetical protein